MGRPEYEKTTIISSMNNLSIKKSFTLALPTILVGATYRLQIPASVNTIARMVGLNFKIPGVVAATGTFDVNIKVNDGVNSVHLLKMVGQGVDGVWWNANKNQVPSAVLSPSSESDFINTLNNLVWDNVFYLDFQIINNTNGSIGGAGSLAYLVYTEEVVAR